MKIYDVSEYARTFMCAKATAEIEISQIRRETKAVAPELTIIAGRKVTEYMFFLTGRHDKIDPLVLAELQKAEAENKKAIALDEIAIALKEKTSTGMDALKNITTSL